MTLKESTIFKRALNESHILGIGFADLNAHLLDEFVLGQYKQRNKFKYFFLNLFWILSKVISFKKNQLKANILFVPAELDKERSLGLYKPLFKYLNSNSYKVISLNHLFNSLDVFVFFCWIFEIPKITNQVFKIIKSNQNFNELKEIKWLLLIDSIVHFLWILQLRRVIKKSKINSVVVDWDRHKLQSLIILAAKKEKINNFTFVHGAIYTPEKFVPLIADNCFVWGKNHVDFYTNLGEENKKLLKVGNTRFKSSLPGRDIVLNKYKIKSDKKIILHPSQNFPDLNDELIIKDLYNFISQNENFQLAVKFHPSQNNAELYGKIKALENLIVLDQSISAIEALAIADFTIIVSSTFAIDALISDVPVAVYNPKIDLRGIAVDLVSIANVPVLKTKVDFESFLISLTNESHEFLFNMNKQRNFIKNYCEYYGEDSARLISKLL
jgi:hypothetical protein